MKLQVINRRKKWTLNLSGIRHSIYNLGFALIKLAICCLRLKHAIEYLAETNEIASIQWSYSTHPPTQKKLSSDLLLEKRTHRNLHSLLSTEEEKKEQPGGGKKSHIT